MTGIVSSMADALVLGDRVMLFTACGARSAFVADAATTAITVPLLLEAGLLLVFGIAIPRA